MEEPLVSDTVFMQDSVQFPSLDCLWLQNSNPHHYFWDFYFHQIWLQRTVQKWSKVTGKHGRHTDGNCSLMTTVGKRLKKPLTFNLPYFVYCLECFFPQLFSFQNENKCERDYVEECMQLSPGRRMGRTVWPKGQTLNHHSSAISYAGAVSFLVSAGLVQQVIPVSTGT